MQKEVMIQTMKLVKFKHLLVNLKAKEKKKKELEDEIKRLKTSINKSRCLKWVVKKNFTKLQTTKNTQSKIKAIKTEKDIGATYWLGCKDFTHNFRPQEVKMTNNMLREKSNYVICQSDKSRFLQQKHNNNKK